VFHNPATRNSLILFGVSVLLWLPRLQGPIDLRYDAGVYYILGTSLAEGKGYRLLNEPGEIAAIQYPPLLPAFVAVHQWFLKSSDPAVVGPWLRYSFCLIFILYIQMVGRMAIAFLEPAAALTVGLITALFLHSFFLSDLLFAEIPFTLVSTLFILSHRIKSPAGFVATALCGLVAFGLRSAGLALLAAWVGESILHRRWKQVVLRGMLALLPVVAWQAYINQVTSGPEYQHPAYPYQRAPYQYYNVGYVENILLVDPFTPERGRVSPETLAERVASNLALMPTSLGEGVTAGKTFWTWLLGRMIPAPSWVAMTPITLVGCLVIAGGAFWLVRQEWLIVLYVAASLVLICLTPWPGQFTRYLTPLTPFLGLALLQGLVTFLEFSRRRGSRSGERWALGGIVSILALVLGTELVTAVHAFKYRHEHGTPQRRLFFYDEKWATFDSALTWLREHAEPGAILATSAPHWAYLETGRRAVMPPMEADPDKAQELLEAVPVSYVIVDELDFLDVVRRYTKPALQRHPDRWRLVLTVPHTNTHIYQRVPESPPPPG
jgi:hypothetical protein